MNHHDIIVNAEAADLVVKNFAKSLDTFRSDASGTASELRSSVHGIERGWSGDTYNDFRSMMERELSLLENCLGQVGSLSTDLYAVSAKFTAMIDSLRKAGVK